MTKRVMQEVNLMDDDDITASSGFRNILFKPWFENDKWGVEIIDGFYTGTIIQFKAVEFIESMDGNVSLDYHVIYKSSIVSDDDIKSAEFHNLLTIIIEDILKEAMEHEIRNNNT